MTKVYFYIIFYLVTKKLFSDLLKTNKMKKKDLVLTAIIFWIITLVISKILLKNEILDSDFRLDLSLHVLAGLFIYIWIYFGIKSLFDSKKPHFKRNVLITFWLCVLSIFLTNYFIFENFARTFLIQFLTMSIFGFIFVFINRKKIFA